ncbi:DHA2 family efflux MFS transporter permease subunit [Nitratireductor sp. XY-223]|uniref:DHA2 family efflux MFS transporter permease subunit n=1 Tax=Nitratireductor sp. XY-223 TaxID=2561926 RepID=UPI0010AA3629|nr:DHA2 family efflux MFS transporter permease subunit [Nitratireductor sp. XY-223]
MITDDNRKWWLLTALAGGLGLVLFDETVVGVALPVIQKELGISVLASHWIVNSYLLVFACLVAIGGRLGDVLPLKTLYIGGTALFGISSIVAGFAPDAEVLIAARAVQGVAAALVFPLSLAIVTLMFPVEEHGRALGIYGMVGTVFLALGPLVGGFLSDYVSWRWIFWVNPFLTAAMIIIVIKAWAGIEENKDRRPLDFPGLVLLCTGVGCLVFALMQGPDYGWLHWLILMPAVIGLAASAAFVVRELRSRAPLIDIALFGDPTFGAANAIIFTAQFIKMAIFIFAVLYFQRVLGLSPVLAGAAIVPAVAAQPFLAAPVGALADKHGCRKTSLVGIGGALVAMLAVTLVIPLQTYWAIFPAFVFWSFMAPMLFTPPRKAVMRAVPGTQKGQAGGIAMSAQMLGGTVGMATCSAVFTTTHSYQAVFAVVTVLTVVVFLYAWFGLKEDAEIAGAVGDDRAH